MVSKKPKLWWIHCIRGQVEALEHAVEEERGCSDVLHQVAAVRGAIQGLMVAVLEEHVRTHIAGPSITSVLPNAAKGLRN